MGKLLPVEHLMLASTKRVKALILEEIALDNERTPLSEQDLLLKSEGLHLSALQLAKSAFGEKNVQTAKHYGNLGRLYQSMRKFSVRSQIISPFSQLIMKILILADNFVPFKRFQFF